MKGSLCIRRQNKTMKIKAIIKGLTAGLALSMVLSMAACSANPGKGDPSGSTPSANESTPVSTPGATPESTPGASTPDKAPESTPGNETLTRPDIDYSELDLSIYVALGQYKDIEISIPKKTVVDEAYINEVLTSDIIYYGFTDKITNRPVEKTDTVSISYAGYLNGVAFEGGTGDKDNFTIYDGGGFIPGFADGLIGATPGTQVDVNVTFPENYHSADLAGKAVVFKVTVHHIYVAKELTDELADEMTGGQFKTAEALIKYYEEYLTDMIDSEYSETKLNLTWEKIVKNMTVISKPDDIINSLFDYELAVAKQTADMYGIDIDTMLAYNNYTRESLKADIEESVLYNMAIYSFIKAENFSVSDEEYLEFIKDSGYTEEELLKSYTKEELLDTVRFVLAQEKAVEFQKFTETEAEE